MEIVPKVELDQYFSSLYCHDEAVCLRYCITQHPQVVLRFPRMLLINLSEAFKAESSSSELYNIA